MDSDSDEQAAPRRTPSLLDLGCRLLDEGSYEDAARAFRRRLRFVPDEHPTRYLLGVALLLSGDPRSAATELRSLPALEYLGASLCCDLGISLRREGQHRLAREWFVRALTVDPDSQDARQHLATDPDPDQVRRRLAEMTGAAHPSGAGGQGDQDQESRDPGRLQRRRSRLRRLRQRDA
jgi:tetratricopeptide (TPR) repeat protein